jgi:hypothetical protein
MDQRLCIKILREGHHETKEIVKKPIQHFGSEAFNYSEVCYWMREFTRGHEQMEDARQSMRDAPANNFIEALGMKILLFERRLTRN